MDNLRLVTAWDSSRLQVSDFETVRSMLALQRACTTLHIPELHALHSSRAAGYGSQSCLQSPGTTGWSMQAVSKMSWANLAIF